MTSHKCARSRCPRPGMIVPGKKILLCLPHQISKPSKYKNVKAESALVGRSFDSRAERKDGEILVLRQKAGEIRNLKFQVAIPIDVNGVRICSWRADFTYEERVEFLVDGLPWARWDDIWHDTKGFRTDVYELKAKLVKAIYGVTIRETGTPRKGRPRGKTPA